jgi:archaellum component FlaC
MTQETENLVLEHLRHIRAKVDKIETEIDDLKHRTTRVELAIVALRRDFNDTFETTVRQQSALDRLSERVERIEKRLELGEGH